MKKVDELGMKLIGRIYEDEEVSRYDIEGTPLLDLPDDSLPASEVSNIVSKILKDVG